MDTHAQPLPFLPRSAQEKPTRQDRADMNENRPENAGMLPGLELPTPAAGEVHKAYAQAVDALRERGLLEAPHEGIAANLLKLATVIDNERKGYAIAQASTAAAALMQTLLDLVPSDEVDDEWLRIAGTIQQPQMQSPPEPPA